MSTFVSSASAEHRLSETLADLVDSHLPWLFLIYALPFAIVLSIVMAPFQVADELAHIERADQIGRGKLVSDRLGGTIDGSWVAIGSLYQGMYFHPAVKQTVALAREAGSIRWSGPVDHVNFQNTAQYGPFLYLPQVIGILLGHVIDIGVVQTLIVARMINALAACGLGFLALSICRRARALTFTTLLLPMTLSQFGSASQDALLISLSILVVAMASRTIAEQRLASIREFAIFAFVVVATALGRPPQFALAFLAPAFVSRQDPAWIGKGLIAAVAIVSFIVWMRILSSLTPLVPPTLSLSGQSHLLLAEPLRLPKVLVGSIIHKRQWWFTTTIGNFGWTDTPMPSWFYVTALGALLMASIAPGNRASALWPGMLALVTFVALLSALCAALYITWTPVGEPTVFGFQGRYILPVLPLLAWAIPEYPPRFERKTAVAWYPVLLFPPISLVVTAFVIMERYYGSWTVMSESLRVLL